MGKGCGKDGIESRPWQFANLIDIVYTKRCGGTLAYVEGTQTDYDSITAGDLIKIFF